MVVAYVSEATPIPLATTHILLHHTIQDDGSPHTFNNDATNGPSDCE